MKYQRISGTSITLTELVAGTWSVPKHHSLRDVRAGDEFGTVKVWCTQHLSWSWVAAYPGMHTAPDACFDLTVQGHPKAVAAELVTIQAFNQGLFEAPISITLAQGLNWAHRWGHGERSEKAEVLDQLYWMAGSATRCLNYDRYHFSTESIIDLLCVIDAAIIEGDWPKFVLSTKKLYREKAMRYDPYADSFGPGTG